MAEADLSPTTFTSRSVSDPDYDISTKDSSENENANTYTEVSSDNSSSDMLDPETETRRLEKNCFSAWASTLNMGLINKVDMVCLSPVGYGV